MRIAVTLTLIVAAAAAAALTAPQADAQTRIFRFQMPSRNIGCLFSSATGRPSYLRCEVRTEVRPEPRPKCRLDWTGYSMNSTGRVKASCTGDTIYDRKAQVFPYTWTWTRGGFSCTVQRAGLRCRNTNGRGFFLSRMRSYAF